MIEWGERPQQRPGGFVHMSFTTLRSGIAASLKTRVLLITLAVFVAVATPAYFTYDWIIRATVVKLGTLFAEKQVLYDRYRGLEPLLREVSIAELLSRSSAVREWAADEASAEKRAAGLAELEHYRLAFKDKSYFFVVNDSGNYYFNDRNDSYAGNQKRYTLGRDNPRDGWYFHTISAGPGCQLNVDHDDNLGVTKVWINCVVAEGSRILGVIGIGVDLTDFIREVVDIPQTGVRSMFVDRSGAIQAHRDAGMIDFHSLTNDTKNKKTIYTLLDKASDRAALAGMMTKVNGEGRLVESRFMRMGGQEVLVGIGYLDQVGWYNITLMNVDEVIDHRLFGPIAALLVALLICAVALMTLLFKRSVLDRIAQVETSIKRVEEGDLGIIEIDRGADEVGRLSRAFARMAAAVADNTGLLETMVHERTIELRRLAHVDPLTGICNRRGFLVEVDRLRTAGADEPFGLLLVDMDLFKTVNDAYGHHGGDRVLGEVARRLADALRASDVCARWGGDEFIVLVTRCSEAIMSDVVLEIIGAISSTPVRVDDDASLRMTVSVGGAMIAPGEDIDAAVTKADAALYAAKKAGRDNVVLYDPDLHAGRAPVRRRA